MTDLQTSATRKQEHARQRRVFADRLRAAMAAKNWTSAQTLKTARAFISPLDNLGHSHMSHYLRGRAIPRGRYLAALSQALQVSEQELLGGNPESPQALSGSWSAGGRSRSFATARPPLEESRVQVRDAADGEAWLEINQRVPWATALEILRLLKSADDPLSS